MLWRCPRPRPRPHTRAHTPARFCCQDQSDFASTPVKNRTFTSAVGCIKPLHINYLYVLRHLTIALRRDARVITDATPPTPSPSMVRHRHQPAQRITTTRTSHRRRRYPVGVATEITGGTRRWHDVTIIWHRDLTEGVACHATAVVGAPSDACGAHNSETRPRPPSLAA